MIALLAVVASFAGPAQVPCVPLPGMPCDPLPPIPCIPLPGIPCDPIPPDPIPCIPLPGIPCFNPPPPPPADTPPEFPAAPLVLADRTKVAVTVRWKAATDDKGILRYLVYRDHRLLISLSPATRQVRVRLRCGRHVYTVIALDSFGQRALKWIRVTRRCT